MTRYQMCRSIFELTCNRMGVAQTDITGHGKRWSIVWPRWCIIALMRDLTIASNGEIGEIVNRSASGILRAMRAFGDAVEVDPHKCIAYSNLKAEITKQITQ